MPDSPDRGAARGAAPGTPPSRRGRSDAAPTPLVAAGRSRLDAWIRAGTAGVYVAAVTCGAIIAPLHLPPTSGPVHLTWWAVAHNNLAVVVLIILGGTMLAVPTLVVGAFNGFMTGALLAALAPTPRWWIAILIHGVPEALGQWCAMVAGVYLALWIYRWLRRGSREPFSPIADWAVAAVLLTCGAAALEAWVSPTVARSLLR